MKTLPLLLHAVILSLAIGITITVVLVSVRRRNAPGATSLIVFALALIIWAISDFLYRAGVSPIGKFWLSATYLGATVVPTALLTFSIEYAEHGYYLNWRKLALFTIEPLLTQALFWTDPWNGLFFAGKGVQTIGAVPYSSPWLRINAIYSYSLMLIAVILVLQIFSHRLGTYRLQSGAILAGALVPILAGIISHAGFNPTPDLDLMLIAYTITGLAFIYGLVHYRLLDLAPVPRDLVIERMVDGWVILDKKNRIVDLNPAAEVLIGSPRHELFGQPADRILRDWPNIVKRFADDPMTLDNDGSMSVRDEWRYLNIRLHPLMNWQGHLIGHTVIWRDITERRKVEEARQRARDEMFVLLRAIYGAASRAQNTDDFLTASIYQIVYTFQSKSCLILLKERKDYEHGSDRLLLAAHHGLSVEAASSMSSVMIKSDMVAWVLENQEPFFIPDISTDPRVPASMQGTDQLSLLIIPMFVEENLLGLIGISREGSSPYRTDEIARITALAEEIASFISTDRRRQLTIALAERQRLVRDLHDSVTQKLYSLVTMTEVAQARLDAGLETGSEVILVQIFSRIGEYARQALKEMRLFLFELQPINLEREGLVTILNQRLAAVEGRADIKARLLADDNISLSLEKEVALYYIAQEALNNILRHAAAKSVNIHLKQGKVNVLLQIEDDGCGFDPKRDDKGGMGLRNMRERVSQIGGKMKIVSTPGKGTRITVIVGKDRRSKARPRWR